MTLFRTDLLRNLGFGFALGTFGLVLANPALLSTLI